MAVCNVNALAYVLIESAQPHRWQPFLAEVVGMMPLAAEFSGWLRFKMDAYCWRLAVVPGDQERLHTAGWELDPELALNDVAEDLRAAGQIVEPLSDSDCALRNVAAGLRLFDPSGQCVELVQSCALDYQPLQSPANVLRFETGFNGDMGLGHYVLPTRQFDACYAFYRELLGFERTDSMHFDGPDGGQRLHFLHVDNPRHHSLAIYEAPQPPDNGCIHLMVEVTDINEVGQFMDRCREHEVPVVSTLGRHCNDQMISVYVESPAGFAIEFGCDGLQLDWQQYRPTFSRRPSEWGHHWQ
ncbi:VOC family protein [Spongiibacter tropicus]|uniref:VOC family protein n=1 Tax=Spongiibacter tropicus TaxID=454602 RepID=UPI0035BE5592